MNIFDRFFGKKMENRTAGLADSDEKFPRFNYELEFLKALNKSPTSKLFGLNTYWEGRYQELLGDLKPILRDFLSNGYLVESLKEESLSLKDLKEILQKNGLPTSGNKEVLAMRISENVSDKSYLKNLDSFYKLTDKGKEVFQRYKEEFDSQYLEFLKYQAGLFVVGNRQQFLSNHFKVKADFPDQRSLGLDSDFLSEKTKKILDHLGGKNELRILSGFPNELILKIKSTIAIYALNFNLPNGFVEEYLREIDFSSLKNLSDNYFGKNSEADKDLNIYNFLLFEFNTLWNLYTLNRYKEDSKRVSFSKNFMGVQILNQGCKDHEKFGVEKYTWEELNKIPALTRSLTCRCIYSLYRQD